MSVRSSFLFLLPIIGLFGCEQSNDTAQGPVYSETPAETIIPLYHLAVHPLHNPIKLAEAYQPLIDYLNQHISDARFELEASRDYQAYEIKFRAREPEFLLPNPWHTLEAMKVGYQVIAMAGDADDFKGIFIVRKNSNIRSPSDLKGKVISYPSHTALAACIMPQYYLYTHGIDINRDVENRYVGSQESSIMNVYLGESAAGATWPPPWRLFQSDHPIQAADLKVIWETPALMNNSVMIRNDIPTTVRDRVRTLLLSLAETSEGRTILSGMATTRFHAANDTSYDRVRDYVAEFEKRVRPVEQP